MKKLTLLRHAKSGDGDQQQRDFDRALSPRGERAARLVGRHLRALGARFDEVVASDAVRVVQTLEGVEAGYGRPLGTRWDRRIYLASAVTLLDIVQALPDRAETALLAGHNPGLEDLILLLVPDVAEDALRAEVEAKFPTASVATLELEAQSWADIAKGTARLTSFTRPRDLDPSLGPGED